jgi:prephenate dehydratase
VQSIRIGFQGERGAFSHRACLVFVQQSSVAHEVEFVSLKSFESVFNSVNNGEIDFGAIPLENSSVGSILGNYDFLWKLNVAVEAEILLPVRHQLIGFAGADPNELEAIYSHPAALDQCRDFIKTLPNAKAVPFWDTSASCLFVKESGNNRLAAIGSKFAAKEAFLSVLKENVEDHEGNNTRFGIISRAGRIDFSVPNGNGKRKFHSLNTDFAGCSSPYKVTCAVQLSHEPGSLARLLAAISELGINLTKIESRPIAENPWHYRFFIDFELPSSEKDDLLRKVLVSHAEAHKFLGRYQNWSEPVEAVPLDNSLVHGNNSLTTPVELVPVSRHEVV